MGELKGHHWKKSAISASELSGHAGHAEGYSDWFLPERKEITLLELS